MVFVIVVLMFAMPYIFIKAFGGKTGTAIIASDAFILFIGIVGHEIKLTLIMIVIETIALLCIDSETNTPAKRAEFNRRQAAQEKFDNDYGIIDWDDKK